MSQATRSRLMLVAAGAVLFTACTASAQFSPPPQREVSVIVPDGGMRVTLGSDVVPVSGSVQAFPPDGGIEVWGTVDVRAPLGVTLVGQDGPIDSNITNSYVPVAGPGGARLQTEVTGLAGGSVVVLIDGVPTVNLTPALAAALAGERDCVDYGIGNVTVDGGVYTFTSVPGQQTAAITLHNCGQNVDYVACFRSWLPDGGPPPSCAQGTGVANVPIHNGETWIVDGLADHHRLRCVACTHAGPPSGGNCLAGGTISICTPSP